MLKPVLESLDGVQEEYHGLYEQDGEIFKLKVEGGVLFEEDVKGLKSALEKEREKRREFADRLKNIPAGQGMAAEEKRELDRLREELEERNLKEAEKRGEFERVKETLLKRHTEEMSTIKEQLTIEKQKRIDRDRTYEATEAISAHDGAIKLLLPVIEKQTRYAEIEGVEGHFAVDEKGEVRFNDKGKPMTIHELVNELKDDDIYGIAFGASGKTGTESPNGRRTLPRETDPSKMTKEDKLRIGLDELYS